MYIDVSFVYDFPVQEAEKLLFTTYSLAILLETRLIQLQVWKYDWGSHKNFICEYENGKHGVYSMNPEFVRILYSVQRHVTINKLKLHWLVWHSGCPVVGSQKLVW